MTINQAEKKGKKSRCCGANLVPITSDEGTSYYQCQLCQMDSDPMEKCKNQLEPTKVFRCVDGCDSELRFYGDMGCLAKSYTGNWTFGINAHFNDVIFYCGKHSKEDAEFEFKKCTSTAGEKCTDPQPCICLICNPIKEKCIRCKPNTGCLAKESPSTDVECGACEPCKGRGYTLCSEYGCKYFNGIPMQKSENPSTDFESFDSFFSG